jgi:hypothetical protein
MGRTVMPYSQVMESERERLKPFRRALSKEDHQAFDRLFDRAKMHTSAGVYMADPWPMDTILLSICLDAAYDHFVFLSKLSSSGREISRIHLMA